MSIAAQFRSAILTGVSNAFALLSEYDPKITFIEASNYAASEFQDALDEFDLIANDFRDSGNLSAIEEGIMGTDILHYEVSQITGWRDIMISGRQPTEQEHFDFYTMLGERRETEAQDTWAARTSATDPAAMELSKLHHDLGKLKWMGDNEGWERAIKAVRLHVADRIAELLLGDDPAPDAVDLGQMAEEAEFLRQVSAIVPDKSDLPAVSLNGVTFS